MIRIDCGNVKVLYEISNFSETEGVIAWIKLSDLQNVKRGSLSDRVRGYFESVCVIKRLSYNNDNVKRHAIFIRLDVFSLSSFENSECLVFIDDLRESNRELLKTIESTKLYISEIISKSSKERNEKYESKIKEMSEKINETYHKLEVEGWKNFNRNAENEMLYNELQRLKHVRKTFAYKFCAFFKGWD